MKALTAVFTYNRGDLLDNCLRSLEQFGPGGDILVVDDGSDQPQQRRVLDAWSGRDGITVVRQEHRQDARLGGLYNNMQFAYDWAAEHGYELLLLNQDDQQFMWRDTGFWDKAARVFSARPKAIQFRPQFEKSLFQHDHANRFEYVEELAAWRHRKARFTAVGVFSVSRLQAFDWSFAGSEVDNHQQAAELELELYVPAIPTMAFVPEAPTWHNAEASGRELSSPREFYLKPLDEQQLEQLNRDAGRTVAYIERYCLPWGWRTLSPYAHSSSPANMRQYRRNLWRWFKKGRLRRWPRLAGVE